MLAQSRSANFNACWNWFDASVRYGGGEVAIAMRAVQRVASEFRIDRQNTFVAGMSSGAALAAAICAHHPDQFAGAMFHSGLAYCAGESAMSAQQILSDGPLGDVTMRVRSSVSPAALVIHGGDDQVVSPLHADELMRQMLAQSRLIRPDDPLPGADKTHTSVLGSRLVTCTEFGPHRRLIISGLGHAWSGGERNHPYFDPLGPSAIGLAREFFEERLDQSEYEKNPLALA